MPRRCDLWRVGVVHAPVAELAAGGLAVARRIDWLQPGRSFTFDADPFGWWDEGRLHLFVEHYDYRTRRGAIDCILLDADFRPVERRRVIDEPWHLSYPVVFTADGALWMMPEAHRSGATMLYRCRSFPFVWERAFALPLDRPAIDATPFHHAGLWWLFFASTGDRAHRQGSLHIRFAERLEGPWRPIAPDPFRLDLAGARPGGQPFLLNDMPVLPVQDCSRTYGGAIRLLRFTRLDPGGAAVEPGWRIAPPPSWAPFDEGLHTLSACGPVTLIDAKRIDRSGRGWLIDLGRLSGWRADPRSG